MLPRFVDLVDTDPEAVALIEHDHVVTRAALLARARELAPRFSAGELVALQFPNSAEFVATLLAAIDRGSIVVLFDRDAPKSEVAAVMRHFGRPKLPPEARVLKLSSGSTGMPKAIVCSIDNLVADGVNICSTMDIRPADTNLGAIPFSHSYGFSNLVTPLLIQGTAVIVSNEYLPLSLIGLANRHRCTIAPLIPMVFEHLASLPLDDGRFESVRTFISAGAPLLASTSRRFRERFGIDIHSFYGCSEVGGIAYDRSGGAVERGTVGTALNGVKIDGGVRGANVTLGYLLDADTFIPFEGRFTPDDVIERRENGEIALVGRRTDWINTAGKKVNPREVEQVILQIEGVRDVKVYGEPAGSRGEVVAAAVVADAAVTRETVREFCRSRLSSHKVPRIVKLIDAIPVDERGKVKRAALAAL
ncbi:MAG TPA: class I adenylate-forming enzyme family protein [Thermoanaerobaculia bacterium]|jgi:acyl-CoA synthetase (AMP-forming)/AMP-acid ligase II|nr:class I adenylate-forming enzyme family protein [Thermoanaerobaculia bacterium]